MEVLRRIKRIVGARQKVGHGGTMDPLATGVLPVCIGQATRLMDHVVNSVKIYRAEITLGVTTTTYDAEGEVVTETPEIPNLTLEMVQENLQAWIGVVNQTPPMYSALKIDGNRLYKLARAGLDVERKTRAVTIYGITILEFSYPKLIIEVECGKGTYIRSLAHDLGESLGCGGHISDLVRLLCGGFSSKQSITLEQLEKSSENPEGWQKHLHPLDQVLTGLKSITLETQAENQLRHGQAVYPDGTELKPEHQEERRAYNSQGVFIALVRFDNIANAWRPIKVFQLDTPSPYAHSSV